MTNPEPKPLKADRASKYVWNPEDIVFEDEPTEDGEADNPEPPTPDKQEKPAQHNKRPK